MCKTISRIYELTTEVETKTRAYASVYKVLVVLFGQHICPCLPSTLRCVLLQTFLARELIFQQATVSGQEGCVRFSAEHKADVNHINNRQEAPLHQSATYGQDDCLKCMLECGARPNVVGKQGRTHFFLTCNGESEAAAITVLDVLLPLKLPFAEINKPSLGRRTPLRQAACRGYVEVVKKLMDVAKAAEDPSGLAINMQDRKKEMTALHRAAWHRHV